MEFLVPILICAASFLYAFYLWRKRCPDTDNEPPKFPGGWPIIGHAHQLIGDSCKLWTAVNDMAQKSYDIGGVVAASIGPRTIYVITDPDDFFTVANTCLQKDDFYDFAKPWLGEGLVTGTLSIWKNHRKLLNPAFSQTVLDSFIGVFNSQSRKLVKDLEKEVGRGMFDHWTYTRHNALETICLTALGVDFGDHTLLNSRYVKATEEIFFTMVDRFQKFWWHSPVTFKWSGVKRTQDRCLKILHNMSYTVLQKRKSEMNGNILAERKTGMTSGTKFKPFMDLLLELAIERRVFNDREIREHVDTMIVGGHDTSANVLMYTLLLLGSHPEAQEKAFQEFPFEFTGCAGQLALYIVFDMLLQLGSYPEAQKKAYQELQEVFEGSDRDVEKHDLSRLVYLEAVLRESMRMYTIVPVVARRLDRNVQLKNYTLAAGRTCFMFLFGIHKHPMWGPDADQFKPDRWLSPETLPDNQNAFVGFSLGRRMCIGKSYAYMSMKTSLAHLLRNYRIHGDHTKLVLKLDVMLKPATGYNISIEKRI